MTQPAKPFQSQHFTKAINKQSSVILVAVLVGVMIDFMTQQVGFKVSKNLLAGCLLAWVGQIVFAKISLSLTGYRQRRQIVHRFYFAHLTKWLINLLGFAFIFMTLKPLSALWVFVGFIILQISYVLLIYKYQQKSS